MHTNQLTCTTNMILSHYVHRLWGLQKRKVLKSILHCNWEIFISPGNSSGTEPALKYLQKVSSQILKDLSRTRDIFRFPYCEKQTQYIFCILYFC